MNPLQVDKFIDVSRRVASALQDKANAYLPADETRALARQAARKDAYWLASLVVDKPFLLPWRPRPDRHSRRNLRMDTAMTTTWRIDMDWSAIIACTLTDEELDVEFDDSYGISRGKAFTAWTEELVLFPAVYDGEEWVEAVPRNPSDLATQHVGRGR